MFSLRNKKKFSAFQLKTKKMKHCILFVLRFYGPVNPMGVMSSAVSLPNNTFTGQSYSSKWLTSIVHILSSETDNCPSWISGRERMTLENISWLISTKECCWPRRGLNPRPPGLQLDGASNWATEALYLKLCNRTLVVWPGMLLHYILDCCADNDSPDRLYRYLRLVSVFTVHIWPRLGFPWLLALLLYVTRHYQLFPSSRYLVCIQRNCHAETKLPFKPIEDWRPLNG